MTTRIYADHNATSPLLPALAPLAAEVLATGFANPSSSHGPGRAARARVETARAQVAELARCTAEQLVFTGSATEANALALRGHLRASGRNKIVVSAIEHASILENASALGAECVVVPVYANGIVDLVALQAALPDAGVCALMWANNETGAVQPIAAAAKLCAAHGVRLHVDAVQGIGKLAPHTLRADTMTISGHKLGALPGIGALCIPGLAPAAVFAGGGQQGGLRGGTEPVPQAILFGAAAAEWLAHGDTFRARMRSARDRFEAALGPLPVSARQVPRLPNTSNVCVSGARGEALLSAMDLEGIAISHGAACKTGALEPSHVLLAMGLCREDARSSVRISFGPEHGTRDAEQCADTLLRCAARIVSA